MNNTKIKHLPNCSQLACGCEFLGQRMSEAQKIIGKIRETVQPKRVPEEWNDKYVADCKCLSGGFLERLKTYPESYGEDNNKESIVL